MASQIAATDIGTHTDDTHTHTHLETLAAAVTVRRSSQNVRKGVLEPPVGPRPHLEHRLPRLYAVLSQDGPRVRPLPRPPPLPPLRGVLYAYEQKQGRAVDGAERVPRGAHLLPRARQPHRAGVQLRAGGAAGRLAGGRREDCHLPPQHRARPGQQVGGQLLRFSFSPGGGGEGGKVKFGVE